VDVDVAVGSWNSANAVSEGTGEGVAMLAVDVSVTGVVRGGSVEIVSG
jgi:hypothetical protein